MSKRFRWVLALTSGILLGLAFPPFPFPWLAWVAYVPLISSLRNCDWRQTAILAGSSHMVAYLIAGHWVLLHADPYTRAASAAGMVWLVSLSALPWIAATVNHRENGRLSALWLVGTIGILEWFQLHTEIGFPWPALGHTQSEFEPFNQLAEIGGVTGLSIWVATINVGFYAVLRSESRERQVFALGLAGLVALPAWLGFSLIDNPRLGTTAATDELRILAVQPAIPLEDWRDPASTKRVTTLAEMTSRAIASTPRREKAYDLVIWPETVIPPTDLGQPSVMTDLSDHVSQWQIPLLAGAIEIVQGSEPNSPYRNAAFLIEPDAHVVHSYRKQRLVPFAEYVPYSRRIPFLRRLALPSGGVWGYFPGVGDGIFTIRRGKSQPARIGVLICFESSFGYLARRLALEGADIIVVLTQDGWWGQSFGFQQHLAFNRLRAIETRLPLVQVSATGVTAHISPTGRVLSSMGWMTRGASTWSVPTRHRGLGPTPYTLFGDLTGPLCAVLIVFLILKALHERFLNRNRPKY